MFHKYLFFIFHVFSKSKVSTSLTDPNCAEICASKNKSSLNKKSIYENMLKSKDTSCLVTCYLTDKGISRIKQESETNSLNSNIILTKQTGAQNTINYSSNINNLTTATSSSQQQVNTVPVKISPNVDLKQVTLNTSQITSNRTSPNILYINSYTSPNNPSPNNFNTSNLNTYSNLSTPNTPLQTVSSPPNMSNQLNTYTLPNNDNFIKLFSDITKKGENKKTHLLTTGHVVSDPTNKKAQNTNISTTLQQIKDQEMINEMIRNHHEKTIKQINIPKQKINEKTPRPGVKEASFVLNNKAKLYKDLNKLDLLIKKDETHPATLYNEANKLKREEIEENTAKLIDEANQFPENRHTPLSQREEFVESGFSNSSQDYNFSDSEDEESKHRKRSHRHKETHSHRERIQNNENEMSLNRKEKELKNEVLKNTNIKKQLADSDLIIMEPTKAEYKNLNPDQILVGISPLGTGHVLTSGNTTAETFANEMEYENLNNNGQNRMKRDIPPSSLFGSQIEFLGGLQNTHNENMNREFAETSMNNLHNGVNINDTNQNINNSNNFLVSEDHRKLIDLENQITDLQNIHKETVENIHKKEIINHLNSIDQRTERETLLGQHHRIEEQLVNEAFQRKHEEEINRRIEEERRIRETMEDERIIQETTAPPMPINYPPIESPPNETSELPPPVFQTEQEEVIQTPTETVASQMETLETVPHGLLDVPLVLPTPPITSNNMIYSAIMNRTTSSYSNNVYTTGLTDVII